MECLTGLHWGGGGRGLTPPGVVVLATEVIASSAVGEDMGGNRREGVGSLVTKAWWAWPPSRAL